jgi:hypothetical protein
MQHLHRTPNDAQRNAQSLTLQPVTATVTPLGASHFSFSDKQLVR